jgi:hypothetical protein
MLERIEALGKPVFITEIGVPSRDDDLSSGNEASSPVHRWDREQQADWAEDMFTVLMSRARCPGDRLVRPGRRSTVLARRRAARPIVASEAVYRRIERILAEAGRIPPHPVKTDGG